MKILCIDFEFMRLEMEEMDNLLFHGFHLESFNLLNFQGFKLAGKGCDGERYNYYSFEILGRIWKEKPNI